MPLRRRRFNPVARSIWWQVVISSTGDGIFLTAFPLLAASLTRDPGAIAGVTVANRSPWILFTLPFGAVSDRFERRRVMVLADIVRGLVVALLTALVVFDEATVASMYACAFVLGSAEVLHATASQALMPLVVPDDELEPYNASLTAAQAATETFVGPPVGSALFSASPSLPFLADAISFAGSVVLAARLPVRVVERTTTRIRDDIREGWRYLFSTPIIKRIAILIGSLNVFYFASEAVLVLYTFEKLHAGKATFTALFVSGAVGLLCGQATIARMRTRFDARGLITISLWIWAASLAVLTFTSSSAVAIAMWFFLGFGDSYWRIVTSAIRQRVTPNHMLGRVTAVHRLFAMGAIPVGAALGGVLSKTIDLRAPFALSAIVFFIFALIGPRFLEPARGL